MNQQQRAVVQQALEAFEHLHSTGDTQVFDMCYAPELIPALRQLLEQPVQEPEPACWQGDDCCPNRNACCDAQHCLFYSTPPAQPADWVGLTDEEIISKALHLSGLGTSPDVLQFARAIEAKLREKNAPTGDKLTPDEAQPADEPDALHLAAVELARKQHSRIEELEALLAKAQPADWVGLTDKERERLILESIENVTVSEAAMFKTVARAIEAKLREKNAPTQGETK